MGERSSRPAAGDLLSGPRLRILGFLKNDSPVLSEAISPSAEGPALGVYVHVPFCSSTCDFCAFYQQKPEKGDFERYIDGIARELELLERPLPARTVFWGGGTPGLLSPDHIRRLGGILRQAFEGNPVEWSVEMTPGSVKAERLEALAEIGVTRISLGAQSFQPRLLDALGRQHPVESIHAAWERLRGAGFANLNLDLMFALPGQTLEEWEADLAEAAAFEPEHISTYCLTFEEDTALYVKLSQGQVSLDEEKEIDFYRVAWARLAEHGYRQYEVSNYARPGLECRHNLNTWDMQEWVGVGPAAASQQGGWRSSNTADLQKWLAGLENRERATEERQELTSELLAADSLIFGLRVNEGVDLNAHRARFPIDPPPPLAAYLDGLVGDGLAERCGPRLRLTDAGRLVVDRIGMEVMGLWEG